jgi:predicted metal-dependent phosphoesterase TrpH
VPGAPTFDLQSHSTHSDGALAPADVVAAAAAAGVELLARLEEFRADRDARAGRMTKALQEIGFEVDEAVLDTRRAEGKPIGRPHLAQAVIGHPANAQRLADEGRDDVSPFIEAYLIPGRPGFRPRTMPSVQEAIAVIHDAGGLAVWAHPFWDIEGGEDVASAIERFVGFGVDGVEAFNVTHTREQTLQVADACAARGLLATGSSDFHGPEHRLFSRFRAFELYDCEPNLGPIDSARS